MNHTHKGFFSPSELLATLSALRHKITDRVTAIQKTPVSNERNIIRPAYAQLPENISGFGDAASPELKVYADILKSLIRVRREMYSDSEVQEHLPKRLGDSASVVRLAQRELDKHAVLTTLQIVPDDDPRVHGMVAAVIDNTMYLNANASHIDFWFFLPQALSFLLPDQIAPSQFYFRNIYMLKEVSRILSDAAELESDSGRQLVLLALSDRCMFYALSYELDIATARVQRIPEGRKALKKLQLPMFENVSTEYLAWLAQPAEYFDRTNLAGDIAALIEPILSDRTLNSEQLQVRLHYALSRRVITHCLQEAQSTPDAVDRMLSDWVSEHLQQRFWPATTANMTQTIRRFIPPQEQVQSSIDLVQLEDAIRHAIRTSASIDERVALEKSVVVWLTSLIRNNVAPSEDVSELQHVLSQHEANCLGAAKLFAMLGWQFGIDAPIVIVEYELDGVRDLHAANIMRYADDSWELHDVYDLPDSARLVGIHLQVLQDDMWHQGFYALEDLAASDAQILRGVRQNTLDAYVYAARAQKAYSDADIDTAFELIDKAYTIDPDNLTIACDAAQIAYQHWIQYGGEFLPDELTAKLNEIFQHYNVIRAGAGAWNNFIAATDAEFQVTTLNIIDTNPSPSGTVYPQEPIIDRERVLSSRVDVRAAIPEGRSSAKGRVINYMVTSGIQMNTARLLFKTGRHIETLLYSRDFHGAEKMLSRLEPQCADRIVREFPLILAFMLELNPAWWRGASLAELAEQTDLNAQTRSKVRKLLPTNLQPSVTQSIPPLAAIASRDALISVFEHVATAYSIDPETMVRFYWFIDCSNAAFALLPGSAQKLLFGVRAEIPLDNELQIRDGFLLGGLFNQPPLKEDINYYNSFIRSMISEHPNEVHQFVSRQDNGLLAENINLPLSKLLNRARGLLAVMAQHIFSQMDDAEFQNRLRIHVRADELQYLISAILKSNLLREEKSALLNYILQLDDIRGDEQQKIRAMMRRYTENDEYTPVFRDAVDAITARAVDSALVRERIYHAVLVLRDQEPGKLLFALYQMQNLPHHSKKAPYCSVNDVVDSHRAVEESL